MKFALFSFIVLVALALTKAAPQDLSALTGAAGKASEAAGGPPGGVPGSEAAGGLGSGFGKFINAGKGALSSAIGQAGQVPSAYPF